MRGFREPASEDSRLAGDLRALSLEPVENAKRVSLFGIIDFDLEAGPPEKEPPR